MEALQQIFKDAFGTNVWLAVIVFALLPITEARLAIPFGLSTKIWANNVLSPAIACLCGIAGSFISCVLIILLLKPIINALKKTKHFKKFASKLESHGKRKAHNINAVDNQWKKLLLLSMFVAIPLPLTGVWTGSLIAVILSLPTLKSLCAIFIGNTIASVIITLLSTAFGDSTEVLMLVILGIALVYVLAMVIMYFVRKRAHKNKLVFKTNYIKEEHNKPNKVLIKKNNKNLKPNLQIHNFVVKQDEVKQTLINKSE